MLPIKPTESQVIDACVTHHHGYGLLSAQEQAAIQREAREWYHVWQKVINEPSYLQHQFAGQLEPPLMESPDKVAL